jgi:uncharacterized SAM-binding protein YcdF (DUF218 family)
MNEFASAFLFPPFPLLLLLVVGLSVRRYTRFRRLGRRTEIIAIVMLVLSVVPLTAKLSLLPLLQAVPNWQDGIQVGAIVVPSGGAYEDTAGYWHPSSESVQRISLAASIQTRLGIPLLITGGKLREDGISEARIVAETFEFEPGQVWLDESARNTHENARALAVRLRELRIDRVLMITSLAHVPRMSASLRANGLKVFAMPVPAPEIQNFGWRDLIPSNHGLAASVAASQVYGGLVLYLVRGWISLNDLAG